MFPWNIAKSAEAMFSRWALKRVCKFFLKKKLGQFIMGEVDLDQLDVQLTQGTIQLTDLAINVDFINAKLGKSASVVVKEGSIGHLLVKMPWSGNGCEVEVNELELVVSPCTDKTSPGGDETSVSFNNDDRHIKYSSTRTEHEMADDALKSTSVDVHEGVKTIANMVKWLLTSFHVKITNIIVAFDPSLEDVDKKTECHLALVLRISEIQCGTSLSEEADSNIDVLGISQLTNFVKFYGAVLELLKIDNEDNQISVPPVSGVGCGETVLGSKKATCSIVTGKSGGFGGNVKLSIPWKNGSLDIRKVDADVYVDPLVLRFQPSTAKWLLQSWETFKDLSKMGNGSTSNNLRGSSQLNSILSCHSSATVPAVNVTSEMITGHGRLPADCYSLSQPDSPTEDLLPAPRFISDWVPFSTHINHNDDIQELDFGASVDQFFECIDGMRNSQSALGSSGMWNWTYSVFSAITAASTLASGSMHVPSDQQLVETNLRATFSGISVVLSFCDEEQDQIYNAKLVNLVGLKTDNLGVTCNEILLTLQVCPQGMTLNGVVKHVEVASFLNTGIDAKNQSSLIQKLQVNVLDALPSSPSYDLQSDSLIGPAVTDMPFGNDNCMMKVTLFRTFGITTCKFTVQSSSLDGCLTGPTSFSLNLPPCIFWLIFPVIQELVSLLKEIGKSLDVHDEGIEILYEASDKKTGSSSCDVKGGSGPCVTSLSTSQCSHGDISISSARVMLCFPFEGGGDHETFFSWEQLIALDFTSPSPFNKGCTPDGKRTKKKFPSVAAQSLQLSFSDLDVYMITSSNDSLRIDSYGVQDKKFSASHFLSIACRRDHYSVVSVVWQGGQVTGPWIAMKARLLANSGLSRGNDENAGGGYEFASASKVKDLEDWKSQTQQEMILSSSFFLHIHLFQAVIDMSDSQYKCLNCLLQQMLNALTCVTSKEINVEKESSVTQSSVLMECDSVEILIRKEDMNENIRSSMQSELPGIWHQFKLKVQKFELLSVSNTGEVKAAGFFRLSHGEGKLSGFTTGVPDHEFLLVTCSNSSAKRGDGSGSNVLSSKCAGSDIIYLSDPEASHDITSITVSCGTVIAVGGRLDWFGAVSSLFSLPASNIEDVDDASISKGDLNPSCSTSFVLSLIDVALSYEPYVKNQMVQNDDLNSKSGSYVKEDMGEQWVACLLAASSLTLSTSTLEDSIQSVHLIRVQDLGLLLHLVSELNYLSGTYSVDHLQKTGYVKVAQEALMEATLKTNCASGLLWELELSKSHLYVETCHDTTATLIRLTAQLQQLFAPDVEESIVHLQNRWDNVQQAQQRNEFDYESKYFSCDSIASTSQLSTPDSFLKDGSGTVGLMDEICEDAFQVYDNNARQSDSSESRPYIPLDGSLIEVGQMSLDEPEVISHELNLTESLPVVGPEGSHASFLQGGGFPEIIESYCLSDLCPLTELSVGIHSDELSLHKLRNVEHRKIEKGSGGWYGGNSFEVLENHISEENEPTGLINVSDHGVLPSKDSSLHSEACGRVTLKKIDIIWRMYSGSDWIDSGKRGQHSGRDTAVCLELALSGMKFQYDIFPVGGLHVSKMSVSVQDFYLYDRSQDAPWILVLGYYHSKDHPRESSSKAFKLDLEAVRPDPLTPLEEYRLNVAVLPMRLHLHQCQVDFLVNFFGRKNSSNDEIPNNCQDLEASKSLSEQGKDLAHSSIAQEALLPYFQKLDIWPILVRVDYSPKHVDLAAIRHGKYVELVNLVPWKGIELNLKHVHGAGIYGWGSVCETTIGKWLEDISQNQIHKILRGFPTVRSLLAVGAGAAKLVSSPVESYKKERRVLKGIQRGTIAFLRSISLEAVGLGVHLAAGAHDVLLQTEYILAKIPSSAPPPVKEKLKTNVRSNQPKDVQQGIQQAYESLSDGLGKSAAVLVQSPLKKYQRGSGAGPALAAAVRAVPAAAIAPASACASAVHYTLLGFRNSLDPERKKESMEKYCPAQPWEEE